MDRKELMVWVVDGILLIALVVFILWGVGRKKFVPPTTNRCEPVSKQILQLGGFGIACLCLLLGTLMGRYETTTQTLSVIAACIAIGCVGVGCILWAERRWPPASN